MITFLIAYRSYPFEFVTTLWGALFYWLPLAICLVGYTAKSMKEFNKDVASRARDGEFYRPKLTIGTIIGRYILSVIPVVNLFTAVFRHLPHLLSGFIETVSDIFDIPLVPKNSEQRKSNTK